MLNVSDKYGVRPGWSCFSMLSLIHCLLQTDDPALLSQMNNDLADEIIMAGLADLNVSHVLRRENFNVG
jgi:hypothetical protein